MNSTDDFLKMQEDGLDVEIISIKRIIYLLGVSRTTASIVIDNLLEQKKIKPMINNYRTIEKLYKWQNN